MNTKHHAEFANLQWDDVRLFRAVLRLGSMQKVASDHGVVGNTIRWRIVRIEARLGLTLIHRSANGIVLTEDGEKLLRIGEAMGHAAEWYLAASSKDVLVKPEAHHRLHRGYRNIVAHAADVEAAGGPPRNDHWSGF